MATLEIKFYHTQPQHLWLPLFACLVAFPSYFYKFYILCCMCPKISAQLTQCSANEWIDFLKCLSTLSRTVFAEKLCPCVMVLFQYSGKWFTRLPQPLLPAFVASQEQRIEPYQIFHGRVHGPMCVHDFLDSQESQALFKDPMDISFLFPFKFIGQCLVCPNSYHRLRQLVC